MNCYAYLIQFIVIFNSLAVNLSADGNRCLVPETYEEKVWVPRVEIKMEEKVSFCWDISKFFRCTQNVPVRNNVLKHESIKRTRLVSKCCDGYKEDADTNCIPVCLPPCVHGNCTSPNKCLCFAGYQGITCLKPCPHSFWGINCLSKCECMNGAMCDSVTGDCFCESGWRGSRCESLCEDGFYGRGCQLVCNCSSGLCNPQTGVCISTTTEATASTVTYNTFTFPRSSNVEVFEETTITAVKVTHKTTLPLESDPLFYLRENASEERTTTAAANLDVVPKNESETSSTATVDFAKTQTFYESTVPETQPTEVQLETASTTEIGMEAEGTKETVASEETTHAVKIFKNLESDKSNNKNSNNNNTSEFVESENEENEIKFICKTEKNYTNEITENELIESTTSGEYVANYSKEIEIEKKDAGADKNDAGGRESPSHAFQFMPSLMVLLGVSIVILIIGARWLIANSRKRKFKVEKLNEDKLFANQANYKFTESVQGNSFFEEPINMADINLSTKKSPPVLLTFKPADT